jgi:molybdenum cofactor cytidylyltransferase
MKNLKKHGSHGSKPELMLLVLNNSYLRIKSGSDSMSVQQYGNMNNTGFIILAAGGSSRFGNIKQLLPFHGKTLLQHVIDEATEAGAQPIIVITGANAKEVTASIADSKVRILINENWQEGMASGIVAGVHDIVSLNEGIKKIIVAVCDQPFVTSALFEQLDQMQNKTGKAIVACSYADTIGTPALFATKYFDQLLGLKGDEGAKKILKRYSEDVATVDFPKGEIDIDTQRDYESLLDEQRHP